MGVRLVKSVSVVLHAACTLTFTLIVQWVDKLQLCNKPEIFLYDTCLYYLFIRFDLEV